ncbi:DUF721 domain-containing protein [Thalassotalea euphylliae]|uniref:DUF721 domain-containing protein n=1 Tax=Thalassotalea euphylliae TaxID=1655234 RepID=UPI0036290163
MFRNNKKPSELASLLTKSSGTLAQINQKTNFLKKIDLIVRQTCPDLPEDTWQIANIKNETVVIEVRSAVWSQRLQFEKNNIALQLAYASEGAINQVQLKVSPFSHAYGQPIKEEDKPKKHMSRHTAEQLEQVAASAPKSLQEKIRKLAKHANK